VKLGLEVTVVAGLDVLAERYDVFWKFPPIDLSTGQTAGPLFGQSRRRLPDRAPCLPGRICAGRLEPVAHLKLLPGIRVDYSSDTGR
jgi:hypothetical protein